MITRETTIIKIRCEQKKDARKKVETVQFLVSPS